jgi:hypothetical protein
MAYAASGSNRNRLTKQAATWVTTVATDYETNQLISWLIADYLMISMLTN